MLDLKGSLKDFTKLAIIGVGSEIRSDDGIGLYIAGQLKKQLKDPRIEVLIGGTTPENLTGPLKKSKPSHILIIDAASAGKVPGTVTLINPEDIEGANFSTHTFSLGIFAKYVQDDIGAKVMVIGIEPKNIEFGEKFSDEVLDAAKKLINDIKLPLDL